MAAINKGVVHVLVCPPVQVHLTHDIVLEGEQGLGQVHPPPRVFGDEITKEEVQEQEEKIKELVESGFGTTELHKFLTRNGKRLGETAKQKVRSRRTAQAHRQR